MDEEDDYFDWWTKFYASMEVVVWGSSNFNNSFFRRYQKMTRFLWRTNTN